MYVCNPSGSRSNQSGSRKNGSRSSTSSSCNSGIFSSFTLSLNSGIFSFSISSLNSGIFSSSSLNSSSLNSGIFSFSISSLNSSISSLNSGIFSSSSLNSSSLNSGIFSSFLNSLSPLNPLSFSLFTLNKSVGSPGTMSAPTTFSLDQSDNTSRKGPGKFFRSSGVCLTQTLYSSPVPLNFAPVDNIACLS